MLAAAAGAFAQDGSPFSLGRSQDIAARPMALGGSYGAVASDASALFYNPAGLSAVKRHEWLFTLEQSALSITGRSGGFPTRSLDQQLLRVQSLGYLMPVPTVRGGLTFAFGFYRPRTFSDLIAFEDSLSSSRGAYRYEAEGTLNHYRAGMGIDLAPDVTLGLALGYVGGREEIRIEDGGGEAYLRAYHGFNLEPALMFKVTPRLRLGASLVAWEGISNLEEVYEVRDEGNEESDWRVKHPFQVKLGAAWQGPSWLLAADYKMNNWSDYRFARDGVESFEKGGYGNEHIVSVGGEKYLEAAGAVLRGGYAYNTLPERSFERAYDLHRASAGVGFLFGGALSLDLAYSFSFWELEGGGLYLENREHRGLLSFAYRY
jgi:long-subunit fatty acid transport protein